MTEGTTQPKSGSAVLAVTGLTLTALTVTGAILRYALHDAPWTQIWFAVSIGGLVGFGTNWVAIKMLFHPRVRVFGVQGVVPARRLELARSVGETLEEHLISGDRMHKLLVGSGAVNEAIDKLAAHLPRLLDDPDSRELITREVTGTIQETMGDVIVSAKSKLKEKARGNFSAVLAGGTAAASLGPLAGVMAAGAIKSGILDNVVDKLVDNMADEMRRDGGVDGAARGIVLALPARAEQILADAHLRAKLTELFETMAGDLVNAVDVAGLIEQELLGRDEGELETLIDRVAANELTFIQVAGGGLGMVAGLALYWPWLLLPIGILFLLMVQVARMAEKKHTLRREAQKYADAVTRPVEIQPELPAPAEQPELPAPEPQPVSQ
ncbi:MAG: DUF445 family protein [Planctomycetes bacterium]|nr:DUF445 family protein [Planctomycetota bacterium]MCB9936547.1 DUF445 family protein [Planctomycetota bacterium]